MQINQQVPEISVVLNQHAAVISLTAFILKSQMSVGLLLDWNVTAITLISSIRTHLSSKPTAEKCEHCLMNLS